MILPLCMAHGIFSRNPKQLAREIRRFQHMLHRARKVHRVKYYRHMIEARLVRLREVLS